MGVRQILGVPRQKSLARKESHPIAEIGGRVLGSVGLKLGMLGGLRGVKISLVLFDDARGYALKYSHILQRYSGKFIF